MNEIIKGNCLTKLQKLEDQSVNCCVTSPPYWGLRDYGHKDQLGLERTPDSISIKEKIDIIRIKIANFKYYKFVVKKY